MPGAYRIVVRGAVVCALVCTAAGCSAGARTEGGQPAQTATDASLLRSRVAVHDRFVELLSRRVAPARLLLQEPLEDLVT